MIYQVENEKHLESSALAHHIAIRWAFDPQNPYLKNLKNNLLEMYFLKCRLSTIGNNTNILFCNYLRSFSSLDNLVSKSSIFDKNAE